MQKLKRGYRDLVRDAEQEVTTLTPAEANERAKQPHTLLVDIRDIRELKQEGKIPGAVHVPRGMLEFWIDPECSYYKSFFDDAEEIIFYCKSGWRSALAAQTAQNMGVPNVAHIAGGFGRWLEDIGTCED